MPGPPQVRSHGDEELFSRRSTGAVVRRPAFVEEPGAVGRSQAQLGQRALHQADRRRCLGGTGRRAVCGVVASRWHPWERWRLLCALYEDRCTTTKELADWLAMYFGPVSPLAADLEAHVTLAVQPALVTLREKLRDVAWNRVAIQQAVKETLAAHGLKMPPLAMAVRVLVCGRPQTRRSMPCWNCSPRKPCWRVCPALESLAIIDVFSAVQDTNPASLATQDSRGYSSAGRALAWHARGRGSIPLTSTNVAVV